MRAADHERARARPPAEAPRPRHREILAALASGFVATLALATSTYNVYLQRQQVRAQVWPRLTFDTQLTPSDGLSITLSNRGVGPAEIKRVRVTVDQKPVEDWPDAITKVLGRGVSFAGITPLEDQVVSPGLDLHVWRIRNFRDSREIVEHLDRLDIELCYCSSLDDCWVFGSPGANLPATTRPIAACVPDAKPFHSISERDLGEMLVELSRDAGSPGDASSGN